MFGGFKHAQAGFDGRPSLANYGYGSFYGPDEETIEDPEQLPLFLTASDIIDRWQVLDGDRQDNYDDDDEDADVEYYDLEDDDAVLERKLEESLENGLYRWIEQVGVDHPVHLSFALGDQGRPQIVGGHHRIASMLDIDPDALIPVRFWPDFWTAATSGQYD